MVTATFVFIIVLRIYSVFSTTIQCYNLTRQYKYNMFFICTHFTNRLGSRRPSMPRTFLGGVPKQVTSSLHSITWRDAKPRRVDTSILVSNTTTGPKENVSSIYKITAQCSTDLRFGGDDRRLS
jgi:hypothetical protein